MDLLAVRNLSKTLLTDEVDEFLLPRWHVIVQYAEKGGIEFTASTNGWSVVPRWIVEATYDFCSMDGYAGMLLGEYLGKLVEEHNE